MKTLFKRKIVFGIPMTLLAAAVVLTPIINNHAQNSIGQIHSINNQHLEGKSNIDPVEYIRKDVALQTDDISTIQEIRLANNAYAAEHSAAVVVKKDGSTLLYMWGNNNQHQLGPIANKDNIKIKNPAKVDFDFRFPIKQVALGFEYSVVLLENGTVYAWGNNFYGQLGIGSEDPTIEPKLVDSLIQVKQIAAGAHHTGALIENGEVYTWGNNAKGQLGIGVTDVPYVTSPRKITLNKVKMLQFGDIHSGAVGNDGVVYMWGDNFYNQLGGGLSFASRESGPKKITIPGLSASNAVKQLSLGLNHSTALLNDNKLFVWGTNTHGQLGIADSDTKTPTELKFDFGSPIKQVSLGKDFSVVLLDDGNVYTWGYNEFGQLGLGDDPDKEKRIPNLVTFPSLGINKVVQIVTARSYTIAILDDSRCYGWGVNSMSVISPLPGAIRSSPTHMTALGKDSYIRANPTLTALEAVNKMWVNNTTNSAGFLKSFELINVPQLNNQSYTLKQAPIFDNYTGEITIEVMIKYFYNQDGELVTDTSTKPMIISGFMPAVIKNSTLTLKSVYSSPSAYQLTPAQLATKLTQTNVIDLPTMLNDYLDIDSKTQDDGQTAKIKAMSIDPVNINNNNGTLEFNLSLENYYENGKELETKSFLITQLRKISSFLINNNYETATGRLTSGEFINQIDALSTSVEYKTMLNDYFSINLANQDTTHTPNAIISDVTATENSNGVVQVEIYFSNFYDSTSQLLPKPSFELNGFIKTSTVDVKQGYEAYAATMTPYDVIAQINIASTTEQYKEILSPYLDLTLNTSVDINSVTPTSNDLEHADGKLKLTLELQNYYEASGQVLTKDISLAGFIKKEANDEVIIPDNEELITPDQQAGLDWWIYLIIAGGSATIIGLVIWLIIKKTRNSSGGMSLKF